MRGTSIMTLGELLFLISIFGIFVLAIVFFIALLRRNQRQARNSLLGILGWLAAYAAVLLGASLLTPQTVLALHQEHCFDEMCFSVTQVATAKTIGNAPRQRITNGIFYIVTVQLRNAALRAPEKPDSPSFVLVDTQGHSYDPSQEAQQAVGQQPSWDSQLQPGEIQPREVVFDVPALLQQPGLLISEGGWPTRLMIGDENSPFHQKTVVLLSDERAMLLPTPIGHVILRCAQDDMSEV